MDGAREQLVGRDQELETIARFLAARDALPAALVVEGIAGIGKTTLWREAIERASESGYRVLTCRPVSTEVHLLFGALSDLLVDNIAQVLPRLPAPQRRAIEVVLLLEDDRGRPAEPRTVAAGVLGVVRELARDEPILLAIDDAQWLDPASAMALEYVLRRLGSAPVAMLASWRIDPLARSAPTGDARGGFDLRRALDVPPQRLPLGPLSLGTKATDSLARVGGRVRQEGLTPTEQQVASLVAEGLTNKEIASELYVSVRAVEANLSRIYAKLEVRSRTELVRRLDASGDAEGPAKSVVIRTFGDRALGAWSSTASCQCRTAADTEGADHEEALRGRRPRHRDGGVPGPDAGRVAG